VSDPAGVTVHRARRALRLLQDRFPGWLITYHEAADAFSAMRPGLLITKGSAAALEEELATWEEC